MTLIAGAWALSASAQTDVSSTYLTNADFEASTATTSDVRGYGKDMVTGDVYGFQAVNGWTSVVQSGDNSNSAYPNSGMGAAVFAYGSTQQMKGNNVTAPAAGPTGSTSTKGLGFFAIWGCGGYYYQEVTLPAGEYTINIPVYVISGTSATTTNFGFYPTSGTAQSMTVPTTTGSWVTLTKSFTLATPTTGQIRIGYKSNGSGSGANPHIMIDKVQILYTAVVVKDALQAAITAATKANATLSDATLTAAIASAQAVYDSTTATQDDVNDAVDALNAAVKTANETAGIYTHWIKNADFASTDNWTAVVSAQYRDWGNGLIGTSLASYAASTVDETHLSSEYYLATQCRWSTNYASYTQTVSSLPAGNYVLTYDVMNSNTQTTAATYENRFTVTVGGTTYTDEATEWMQGATSWTTHTVKFNLSAAADVTFSFGYGTGSNNFGTANTPVLYISHLALKTVSDDEALAAAKALWQAAQDAAEAALNDGLYDNVYGKDRSDLETEWAKTDDTYTTVADYEAATAALTAATTAFTQGVATWDALQNEIDKAYELGVSPQDAEEVQAAATATAADALAATQDLKVQEYNYVTTTYQYGVELGEWTSTGTNTSAAKFNNEHWSGTTHEYVNQNDGNGQGWNANSWSLDIYQDIELPAGDYIFKAAGRKSDGATVALEVTTGGVTLGTVNDFPSSNNSRGIDTSGATNFDPSATYANNNNGFGWEWRYVKFSLSASATVRVAISAEASTLHQWFSIGDYTVNTNNEAGFALIDYNIALANAQAAAANSDYANVGGKEQANLLAAIADDATLDKTDKAAIEAATQTLKDATTTFTNADVVATYNAYAALTKLDKISTNIGSGPFQYNSTTNDEAYTAYEITFGAVTVDETTTATTLQGLLNEEAAAREAYVNQELNAPENKAYNIVIPESHVKAGNAVVASLGATTANNPTGYSFNASRVPTGYLAQGFYFTPVSGKVNTYKIQISMPEGWVYLTYGALNGSAAGWANQQIQGTTDADAAGEFRIVGSETENQFKIFNTIDNNFIDCQDGGALYTDTGIELEGFSLSEAPYAELALSLTQGKFATRIFPFTPTTGSFTNAKVYRVNELDADGVTLVLVEETSVTANVPYVIEATDGEVDAFLSGLGMAAQDTYTAGMLTGAYVETQVPQGNYVLQTQGGEQKFFQVKSDDITMPAYRAYLTVPSGGSVKEFLNIRFDDGEATGITALDALNSGKAVIYDASGVRQTSLQKGLNILKMQDGSVRKIMVK